MFILVFFCGAIITSFIVLCATRIPNGQLPWSPKRSYCDHCQSTLRYWQLIPILGYLLQKGCCHFCHKKISFFFPCIEIINGIAYTQLVTFNPINDCILCIFLATLTFNATTDHFKHYIYPITLLGLYPAFYLSIFQFQISNLYWAIGIAIFLSILAQRGFLGWGDVEYLITICLLCGGISTLLLINFASWISLITMLLTGRKKLAFIPSLALGTIILLILH